MTLLARFADRNDCTKKDLRGKDETELFLFGERVIRSFADLTKKSHSSDQEAFFRSLQKQYDSVRVLGECVYIEASYSQPC